MRIVPGLREGLRLRLRSRLRLSLRPLLRPREAAPPPAGAREDRFGLVDLLAEATKDIGARPTRLLMTVAGTVLGVGALVATVGFAQTSALHIADQFDAVASTQAVVSPVRESGVSGEAVPLARLSWDAESRIQRIGGVEHAATLSKIDPAGDEIRAVQLSDPSAATLAQPHLYAASPDILGAVGGAIESGRMFDRGHDARADRVAVLSARAAERFGIGSIDSQPSVFVGGTAYAVIGVYGDVEYEGDLQDAMIIPAGTGRAEFGLTAPDRVQVRLAVDGGPILYEQAPLVLAPDAPATIEVAAPTGPSELRTSIQSDVNLVFVILAVVVLLAGGLGIANVTMLSVMERVGEIGLRRAVGSTPRQIAAQFVAESVVIGLLGGLIGSALGVASIVVVAMVQGWTPVAQPGVAVGGVVVGALVGLVAGGLPARRAARIEPVDALRGQ